ncbi:MAG TPA: hypothetical protein VLS88_03520 [Polyangiales bacterium]|nr:hypothetical protein [Polyangiales bacterium]
MRYWISALMWVVATVAYAQAHLPARDMRIEWDRGSPKVSFSAKDLAEESVRQELSSGLRKRLQVTVSAHFKGSNRRMAMRQFTCDVTRDLWEDGYVVRIGTGSLRFKTLDQVLDHCLAVKGLFVGEPKSYASKEGREIYFYVRAEFNPISKKQCQELIRPSAGDDPVGPITISIVRRRICQAERTLEFRSDFLKVPE